MRRSLAVVLLVGVAGLSATVDASAQAMVSVSGAATFPMRDYGEYASTGWIAHAGVGFPVGDAGLALGAAGYFGSNSHQLEGDKTNLYGGVGVVQHGFGEPEAVSPFVFGIAGLMVQSYTSESQPAFEGSDAGLAAGAGAGVSFPLGGIMGVVEGWLLHGFLDGGSTTIAGLSAGVSFPLGAGGI